MEFKEIKELFDIKDDSYGSPIEEIQEAEKRLGLKLPLVLKGYYQKLGKHQKLNHTQDNLIALGQLEFNEDDFLVFYSENQHVATWGIKKADFGVEDPVVYRKYDKSWELDSKLLSRFLNSMAFMQAIYALGFYAGVCGVEIKYLNNVTDNYEKIDIEFPLWNVKFYRNRHTELIAVFDIGRQIDIFVSAKNNRDFEEIILKLDFEWDFNTLED